MRTLEQKLKHYRISASEYELMRSLLNREPKEIEWPLFSALWSEHCSYKSSKVHLRKFAQTMNKTVVNAAGENAGVIDLGKGERVVFKMESHNHPSFIEPYQGAATGVGGILRDIFTMGARPIALADFLCFGEKGADRMASLAAGVVHGISGYGNSVGVPTIQGKTYFDKSYNKNILVNAMAVGLLRKDEKISLSAAKGKGNFVVYVGAKTGKDGVHGAAMASESFDENSEAKKPNVQIGDPYFEKLLIESCFEVLQKNLVVAIQDMGAAGLTSSSFEMASKGQVGMKIQLDLVPIRDASIQPEEILLSESQERMLLICEPQKFDEIFKIFARWGLDAVRIGEVVNEREVQLYWKGELLTAIDPDLLVENAPVYERKFHSWKPHSVVETPADIELPRIDLNQYLLSELSSVHFSSKEEIFRQYDQRVGLLTARGADYDVAFQRLPDSHRGLAIALGCRPFMMQMDAEIGAYDSVAYPTLQMAIKGAKALAVTDCLNFANPEKENIMSEFAVSVEAIRQASIALSAPVISGNVSFYNETLGSGITSTPATGLVGLRENVLEIPEDQFQKEGNPVYRLSLTQVFSRGYMASHLKQKNVFFGSIDIASLARWRDQLLSLSFDKSVASNQMIGRGGLLFTAAKMSTHQLGFECSVKLAYQDIVGESLYQSIWEVHANQSSHFEKACSNLGLKFEKLGHVAKERLQFGEYVRVETVKLVKARRGQILKKLEEAN